MKLWVDDVRPAPDGYWPAKDVRQAKLAIQIVENSSTGIIEFIDVGHDGDGYAKLFDWLEKTGRNYPIRIHSSFGEMAGRR